MAKLSFGWSEKNILPEGVVIDLAGQFYERISGEVESPLTVTALVMEGGGDAVIFCSCDLVSTSTALLETVRQLLSVRPD